MISWNMNNDRIMAELEKKQEEYPIHSNLDIKSPDAFKPEEKSIIQEHIDNLWRQETHNTEMWILCEMAKRYISSTKEGKYRLIGDLCVKAECLSCGASTEADMGVPKFCSECGVRFVEHE